MNISLDQLELNGNHINHSLESGEEFDLSNRGDENVQEISGCGNVDADAVGTSLHAAEASSGSSGSSGVYRRLQESENNHSSLYPLAKDVNRTIISQATIQTIIADVNPTIWGRYHPNFNQPNRIRAVWSDAELHFLGQVLSEFTDERYERNH